MNSRTHKPQLDALRAFAVLAVWVVHFWPDLLPIGNGVRFFFTLSGFLITGILLDRKSQIENVPDLGGRVFVLRQFYARRFLRILPAYYVLLLVLAYVSVPTSLKDIIWFHASFTSNFRMAFDGSWEPWVTVHFWSLAVEEQFYLFWPLLVLWLPRRHLWVAVIFLLATGPAFRGAMLICGANEVAVYMLTPASFTALGCGALLALVREMPRAQSIIRLLGVTAFIALVAMDVTVRFGSLDVPLWVRYAVTDTLCTAALTALLSKAAEGFTGPVGALLTLAPLRYLGRISYGLYLYHLPALLLVIIAFNKVGLPIPDPGPIKLLIVGAVTVVAAALSWHLFEEPINRLKRLLPYQARRRVIVWAGSVAGSGVGV